MKTKSNFNGKGMVVIFIAIALMSFTQSTFGQNRFGFEFRPGVNLATKKLGDTNLKTGFGFEGAFSYRFMPHLGVYAGWSWNKFASDNSFAGANVDFEETGYSYGLQFIHPIGTSKINLLARAGGLANHIEVEKGGAIIADSGHGFGWQVEGGVAIPIGERWSVLPSVRYRSLARDIKIADTTTGVDLNYLSVGIGVSLKF
jgi:hypothetical protein